MLTSTLIGSRHRGLPEVAHGGYVAGVLAAALGVASAEVHLRRPVPLGRNVQLDHDGGDRAALRDGDTVLAEGAAASLALDVPSPVTPAQAEAAAERFIGLDGHPFPGCLACGTTRRHGDGLRIFPGAVPGRRLVAAPWIPAAEHADADGRVPAPLVWAALDCPQLWSLIAHVPRDTEDLVVTATLAATLTRPVMAGEPHVVIGWPLGRWDRRWLAGAAIIGPGGEICAAGRQEAAVAGWGVPLGRDRLRAMLADVAAAERAA